MTFLSVVTKDEGIKKQTFLNLRSFFETSAKRGENIKELF